MFLNLFTNFTDLLIFKDGSLPQQSLKYAVCPAHNDQKNIGATAEI